MSYTEAFIHTLIGVMIGVVFTGLICVTVRDHRETQECKQQYGSGSTWAGRNQCNVLFPKN